MSMITYSNLIVLYMTDIRKIESSIRLTIPTTSKNADVFTIIQAFWPQPAPNFRAGVDIIRQTPGEHVKITLLRVGPYIAIPVKRSL